MGPQVNVYDYHNKTEYEVDERIVKLLERLWKVGMVTWQCCGGHGAGNTVDEGYSNPYIAYDFKKTYAPLAGRIQGRLGDNSDKYCIEYYYLDDEGCLERCDDFGADIAHLSSNARLDENGKFIDTFPEFEKDLIELCDIYEEVQKPFVSAMQYLYLK